MEIGSDEEFRQLLRWSKQEQSSKAQHAVFLVVEFSSRDSEMEIELHGETGEEKAEEHKLLEQVGYRERERLYHRRLSSACSSLLSPSCLVKYHFLNLDQCPATAREQRVAASLPTCRIYRNGMCVGECRPAPSALRTALQALITVPLPGDGQNDGGDGTSDVWPVPFEALIEEVAVVPRDLSANSVPRVQPTGISSPFLLAGSGMEIALSSFSLRRMIAKAAAGMGGAGGEAVGRSLVVLWYKAEWLGTCSLMKKALAALTRHFKACGSVSFIEVDVELCSRFILCSEYTSGATVGSSHGSSPLRPREVFLPTFVCLEYDTERARGGQAQEEAGGVQEEAKRLFYHVADLVDHVMEFTSRVGWWPHEETVTVEEVPHDLPAPLDGAVEDYESADGEESAMEVISGDGIKGYILSSLQAAQLSSACSGCGGAASQCDAEDPLFMVEGELVHGSHLKCYACDRGFTVRDVTGKTRRQMGGSGGLANSFPLMSPGYDRRPVRGRGGTVFHALCKVRAQRQAWKRYNVRARETGEEVIKAASYSTDWIFTAAVTTQDTCVFATMGEDNKRVVHELPISRLSCPGEGSGVGGVTGDLVIYYVDGSNGVERCIETASGGIVKLSEKRLLLNFNRSFASIRHLLPDCGDVRVADLPLVVDAGEMVPADPNRQQTASPSVGRWVKAALLAAVPAVGALFWSQKS